MSMCFLLNPILKAMNQKSLGNFPLNFMNIMGYDILGNSAI